MENVRKKHATEYTRVTQSKKNETGNIVDFVVLKELI